MKDIISDKSKIWTSTEVHEAYLLHGVKYTIELSFPQQKHFDDKLVLFFAPGLVSSLLVFRDTVPRGFRLVDDNDDDVMIKNISKTIHKECKLLYLIKTSTQSRCISRQGLILLVQPFSLLENLSNNPGSYCDQ